MDTSLFLKAVIVHFQVSESHLRDREILIPSVKWAAKRILTLTHASLCRIYFPSLNAFCPHDSFKSATNFSHFLSPFLRHPKARKQKFCQIFKQIHFVLMQESQYSAKCQQSPSALGIPVQNSKFTLYKAFFTFTACFLQIVSIRSKLTLVNGGCLRRNFTFIAIKFCFKLSSRWKQDLTCRGSWCHLQVRFKWECRAES